jgi:hypothetical protein
LAYVTIPKDLTKVKSKVLFGLTKRQLICFGAAALIGVPLFFLLRRTASNSAAAFCMIIVMLPFFLLAMYERHGQPLEVVAGPLYVPADEGAALPDKQFLRSPGAAGPGGKGGESHCSESESKSRRHGRRQNPR